MPAGGAVGIFARSPKPAVFHKKIFATKAETVAGGVEAAISDHNVLCIVSGNAVVTRSEVAVLNPHLGAVMEVHAIVAAQHCDMVHVYLGAGVQLVAPVGRIAVGVAPEGYPAAAAKYHAHGSPEVLFAVGIQAVGAVNPGARLSDDGHILSVYGSERRIYIMLW